LLLLVYRFELSRLEVLTVIVFAIVSSGRELFMADSSVFVDDAEAYDVYERQEESEANEEPSNKNQDEGPSSSTSNGKEVEESDDEDINIDDDLDIDELNELEASLSRTSIQIREPGEGTSS
jgi:TATA-binding protein-associated factor Taf7